MLAFLRYVLAACVGALLTYGIGQAFREQEQVEASFNEQTADMLRQLQDAQKSTDQLLQQSWEQLEHSLQDQFRQLARDVQAQAKNNTVVQKSLEKKLTELARSEAARFAQAKQATGALMADAAFALQTNLSAELSALAAALPAATTSASVSHEPESAASGTATGAGLQQDQLLDQLKEVLEAVHAADDSQVNSTQLLSARLATLEKQIAAASLRVMAPKKQSIRTTENDLSNTSHSHALQDIYEIYHKNRRDTCDGCRYIPFIQHLFEPYDRVFDGGAANCEVLRRLRNESNKSVRGVEFSEWILENYCEDLVKLGWVKNSPLHAIPFEDAAFDVVLCTDVLEHVPEANVDETLTELTRIARQGAHYLVTISHEPAQKDKKSLTKDSTFKIHETVRPRKWWLGKLNTVGLVVDTEMQAKFFKFNEKVVRDPRYLSNQRHRERLYLLTKM
ncbi:hypothetical protein CYMTET_40648 [Cymbomonas tetramitiformis]|uniref:Methyltransferase type 11 domain-containing protein n=1 Tax=Cymbomonas tetramitiformis TaxID=36881 RepID=A0AAE0C7N2_9CHLO|nr:hypothetical protein CYMTET_40648 [Cymbomonas tetramitiformis]